MKKRLLFVLALSVSFMPAAFAQEAPIVDSAIGQHIGLDAHNPASLRCAGQKGNLASGSSQDQSGSTAKGRTAR